MEKSNNINIGWLEISKKKYGGNWYNEEARKALSTYFNVETIVCEPKYFKWARYLRIPESLFCLSRLSGHKDLWVRDFYSTITLPFDKTKGKNLAMIHHLDFSGFPWIAKPPLNMLSKLFFYSNLKKFDAIVTVSGYWRDYFVKKGYKNVYKIYNGFNVSDFSISNEEVQIFIKKYNLSDKPIIYLGNCQRAKGVVESYNALKDLDVHLITSGRRHVKIPVLNLDLEHRDYLKLLKASSVVVTMSKFKEGWCRTAHESMLLKTPVIGSGLGGMRELLEGGKQIVCQDFKDLKEEIEYLLNHPELKEKMGENGYNFAKNFTLDKFEKQWIGLISRIVALPQK